MRRAVMITLALLALAGCSNQALGPSAGKPFALNIGYWTPTAADLDVKGDQ